MSCHDSCATECFTILDSAASKFQIKIKEALHIKWENSILNQQLKHLDLSPSFKLCCSFFSFILLFLLSARLFCFPRISDSNCSTMQVLKPNFRKCLENNAMFTSVIGQFCNINCRTGRKNGERTGRQSKSEDDRVHYLRSQTPSPTPPRTSVALQQQQQLL